MGTGGFELSDNERNPPSHGCKRTRHNNRHTATYVGSSYALIPDPPTAKCEHCCTKVYIDSVAAGCWCGACPRETGDWAGAGTVRGGEAGPAPTPPGIRSLHQLILRHTQDGGGVQCEITKSGLGWAVQYYHNFALAASPYI